MNKFKLIIPEDFLNEIDENAFEIQEKKELQMSDSNYHMSLLELGASPEFQVVAAYLSLIALPLNLQGIYDLIKRVKNYLQSKHDKRIIIQIKGQRYVIDNTTPEESYQKITDLLNTQSK